MKRLVVDVREVVLAGAAVGTFLVVVSGKSLEDCDVVSSNNLSRLRIVSPVTDVSSGFLAEQDATAAFDNKYAPAVITGSSGEQTGVANPANVCTRAQRRSAM